MAATRERTCSAESTFGTAMASGPAAQTAARSSSCQAVPTALTRTTSSRYPYCPLRTASQAASRAAGLAAGATASSRSRMIASQSIVLALARALALAAGMYSTERRGR